MTQLHPSGFQAPATAIPPVTEADIRGIANMIVTRHGDGAMGFAAEQMARFHRLCERKEHAMWLRIGLAVGERHAE